MQSLIVIVVLWSWQMYSPSSLMVNLDTHLKVSTAFLPNILESCTLGTGHLSTGGSHLNKEATEMEREMKEQK